MDVLAIPVLQTSRHEASGGLLRAPFDTAPGHGMRRDFRCHAGEKLMRRLFFFALGYVRREDAA